jgi:hypothetical protein
MENNRTLQLRKPININESKVTKLLNDLYKDACKYYDEDWFCWFHINDKEVELEDFSKYLGEFNGDFNTIIKDFIVYAEYDYTKCSYRPETDYYFEKFYQLSDKDLKREQIKARSKIPYNINNFDNTLYLAKLNNNKYLYVVLSYRSLEQNTVFLIYLCDSFDYIIKDVMNDKAYEAYLENSTESTI